MSGYRRWTSYWWGEKWRSVRYFHRTVAYKYRLLCDYGPEIWQQHDWDQVYLYRLLLVKFKRLRRRAETDSPIVNWHKQARQFMICENLLKRLLSDEYCVVENARHDDKWGKLQMTTSPDENKHLVRLNFVRERSDDNLERKEMLRIWKHEEYMKKQDVDYLFHVMSKHIQTWWD